MTQEAQQTLLQNKINRVFIYSSSVMWTGGLVCEMNVCIVIKKKKTKNNTKPKNTLYSPLTSFQHKNIAGEGSTSAAKIYKFLP